MEQRLKTYLWIALSVLGLGIASGCSTHMAATKHDSDVSLMDDMSDEPTVAERHSGHRAYYNDLLYAQ